MGYSFSPILLYGWKLASEEMIKFPFYEKSIELKVKLDELIEKEEVYFSDFSYGELDSSIQALLNPIYQEFMQSCTDYFGITPQISSFGELCRGSEMEEKTFYLCFDFFDLHDPNGLYKDLIYREEDPSPLFSVIGG